MDNFDLVVFDGFYKLTVTRFDYVPNRTHTRCHLHNLWELHFVETGKINFTLDLNKILSAQSNTAIIIGRNIPHEEFPENSTGFCVGFKIELGEGDFFESDKIIKKIYESPFIINLNDVFTKSQLKQTFVEFEEKNLAYLDVIKSIFKTLFLTSFRNIDEKSSEFPYITKNGETIDFYFNQIMTHDKFDLSPTELAEILHMSERTLNREMHKIYGYSFKEYLTIYKFLHIKNQIMKGRNIQDIAEEIGWSETYLRQRFKVITGETIAEFKLKTRFEHI